jgi:hypothetical protein
MPDPIYEYTFHCRLMLLILWYLSFGPFQKSGSTRGQCKWTNHREDLNKITLFNKEYKRKNILNMKMRQHTARLIWPALTPLITWVTNKHTAGWHHVKWNNTRHNTGNRTRPNTWRRYGGADIAVLLTLWQAVGRKGEGEEGRQGDWSYRKPVWWRQFLNSKKYLDKLRHRFQDMKFYDWLWLVNWNELNSMEQLPFEADTSSASQRIPRIL